MQEAIEAFEQVKEIAPKEPAVFAALAETLIKMDSPIMALKALIVANDLEPGNPRVTELLGKYQQH